MKKLFLLPLLLLSLSAFGQSAKEMLAEIEGKWELDNSGNVTFSKVIEVPDVARDEIYTRALGYFTYNYNSGDDVIQVQEKEKGTIIGKGIYAKVHIGVSLLTSVVDTYHIIRLDIKDGKARAIITLQQYLVTTSGGGGAPSINKSNVADRYPVAEKDFQKTIMTKAFYKSYQKAMTSFDAIEKTLKEGSTGAETKNDW